MCINPVSSTAPTDTTGPPMANQDPAYGAEHRLPLSLSLSSTPQHMTLETRLAGTARPTACVR